MVPMEDYVLPTEACSLPDELIALVRSNLSRHMAPHEVRIVESLPKTPSGKVQRYLLRQSGSV